MDFVREIGDEEAELEIRKMFTAEEWQRVPAILKTRFKNIYRSTNNKSTPKDTFKPSPESMQNNDKHGNECNKNSVNAKATKSENKSTRLKVVDIAVRRNPKRKVVEVNNFELGQANKDKYVTCDNCQEDYLDVCSGCTSLVTIKDFPVPMGTEDRAKKTIPRGVLELRQSQIYGNGVFTTNNVRQGVQLGPYEGQLTRVETTNGYSFKLREGRLIDVADKTTSNWMRYVNCARNIKEQNVIAFQQKGSLYYRTCKNIEKGKELLVSYGTSLSRKLTIEYFEPNREEINLKYYSCQFCCMGFSSETFRSSHEKMCVLNSQRKKHESRCSKRNTNKKKRKANSLCTKKEQMFNCNHCDHETKSKRSLKNHITTIHNKGNATLFTCHRCKFSTYYKTNLNRHLRTHSEHAVFKCESCQKGFIQKLQLDSHVLNNHKDLHHLITSKIHKCTLCKYTTLLTSNLRIHSLIHSKKNAVRYQCQKCEYVAYTKGHLTTHLLRHSSLKPHICKKCKKGFTQKFELDSHILHKHKDEADLVKTIRRKIYKCPDCQYKTVHTLHLNKHRRVHR